MLIHINCESESNLKEIDINRKYEKAMKFFTKKKYYRAKNIFEDIVLTRKNQHSVIKSEFYLAKCYEGLKDYERSIVKLKTFYETYPSHELTEEAIYTHAKILYGTIPQIKLDQEITQKGLQISEYYLNQYPQGKFVEAIRSYKEFASEQIIQKNLQVIQYYLDREKYIPLMILIDHFIEKFPDSIHVEKVSYWFILSVYKTSQKKKNAPNIYEYYKLYTIANRYKTFLNKYPQSQYIQEVKKMYEDIIKGYIKKQRENRLE